MNYDVGMSAFILDSQSGECCSPSPLPRTSNSSAYRLNYTVNMRRSSHYKRKLWLRNTTYYLPKPISSQDKHFIDAFFSSFSAFASPLSRSKAYNTAESSCIQIAIVSSVRINIRQCTSKRHGTRRYYGIIRNSRNVGKLSACANSGYQALFSDFLNGSGYEASPKKHSVASVDGKSWSTLNAA